MNKKIFTRCLDRFWEERRTKIKISNFDEQDHEDIKQEVACNVWATVAHKNDIGNAYTYLHQAFWMQLKKVLMVKVNNNIRENKSNMGYLQMKEQIQTNVCKYNIGHPMLKGLCQRDKFIVILYYAEESGNVTHKDLSKCFKISVDQVRNILKKARQKILENIS